MMRVCQNCQADCSTIMNGPLVCPCGTSHCRQCQRLHQWTGNGLTDWKCEKCRQNPIALAVLKYPIDNAWGINNGWGVKENTSVVMKGDVENDLLVSLEENGGAKVIAGKTLYVGLRYIFEGTPVNGNYPREFFRKPYKYVLSDALPVFVNRRLRPLTFQYGAQLLEYEIILSEKRVWVSINQLASHYGAEIVSPINIFDGKINLEVEGIVKRNNDGTYLVKYRYYPEIFNKSLPEDKVGAQAIQFFNEKGPISTENVFEMITHWKWTEYDPFVLVGTEWNERNPNGGIISVIGCTDKKDEANCRVITSVFGVYVEVFREIKLGETLLILVVPAASAASAAPAAPIASVAPAAPVASAAPVAPAASVASSASAAPVAKAKEKKREKKREEKDESESTKNTTNKRSKKACLEFEFVQKGVDKPVKYICDTSTLVIKAIVQTNDGRTEVIKGESLGKIYDEVIQTYGTGSKKSKNSTKNLFRRTGLDESDYKMFT